MTLEELKQDIKIKFPELFNNETVLLENVRVAAIQANIAATIAQAAWAISYSKNKEWKPSIYDTKEHEKWQVYQAYREEADLFKMWLEELKNNQTRQLTLF